MFVFVGFWVFFLSSKKLSTFGFLGTALKIQLLDGLVCIGWFWIICFGERLWIGVVKTTIGPIGNRISGCWWCSGKELVGN